MDDSSASPLVLTKLRAPVARPRLVSRARLLDCLADESSSGLILVCAPAGYGKTTLLAEWAHLLRQSGTAVAWYALDAGDADPIAFSAYLVASFMDALGPLPELVQAAQRLRAAPESDPQRVLPALINSLLTSGRACTLILDDYHLVDSPAIHAALVYLYEHRPGNLRIAIGSRADPPLSLARLRASGDLLEIRAAGLRFTGEEAGQFLNEVMRLDLSPAGVDALAERTEGWAAGLQLAALSLAGRPDKETLVPSFSGSHRYLVEYLLEEVVGRLSHAAQAFLFATAVLERLCAPLCNALLGQDADSQATLEHLEQSNLFLIALDDQRRWFRYHHLFRDFLQARLEKRQPERIPGLHRAACEWLAGQGLLREAAAHAFQSGDWEYAAAFVEQHSFTMIIHTDTATLYEWCATFPEEVMDSHPLLCILQCWAWVFSFRQENRTLVEARLRQAAQAIARMEDRQAAAELSEHAAVVRSFLNMAPDPAADPRPQLAAARDMLSEYPAGEPGQFSGMLSAGYMHLALHEAQAAREALETALQIALRGGLFAGIIESTFHLARLACTQGELRRSVELCRRGQAEVAVRLSHPEQALPGFGCLDIALGCALLEQDRLNEAEEHLRRGLEQIGYRANPYYLMTAQVGLARLDEIRGRSPETLEHLAQIEAAWPDITFCTRGLRAAHCLRAAPGSTTARAEADAWLCAYTPAADLPAPGMGPFGAAEIYYLALLAWLRCQIAAGTGETTRWHLQRQLELAQANGLVTRVIELSLLEAELEAQDNPERSWAALKRALRLARAEDRLRIFDQSQALAHLLREALHREIEPDFVGQILSVIEQPVSRSSQAAPAALVDPLSERELEVLRMVASGASNQAIAAALYITIGTVKSHVNHILGKLDARSRTEAAAKARELGLL